MASACARAAPAATLFFVSSSEVYGRSFSPARSREDAPLQPMNVYARSKAAAEQVLADVLPAEARLIVARSFNHTGPGQDERFVLPSFAAQIARIEAHRQPAEIRVGNLDAERDFLDVRDVCRAYVALIKAAPALPARSVFNVSSGSSRSIGALLEILAWQSSARFEVVVDHTRLRSVEIPNAVGRNDLLRAAVDWTPIHPIEETLAALLQRAREKDCVRGRQMGRSRAGAVFARIDPFNTLRCDSLPRLRGVFTRGFADRGEPRTWKPEAAVAPIFAWICLGVSEFNNQHSYTV